MTQFAIPNADPVATLTFEDVVTVDISTFDLENDWISLSLPEFPKSKLNINECFIDFTSNAQGNFDLGPTDHFQFGSGVFLNEQPNGDVEARFGLDLFKTVDLSAISGVRFRLLATSNCTFRCLAIRAISGRWKYAPIDFNTLWHRVDRPPSPNGSINAVRTNLAINPSVETNSTGWSMTAPSWTSSSLTRAENTEIPIGSGQYALQVKAQKDATATERTLSLIYQMPSNSVTGGNKYSFSVPVYVTDQVNGSKGGLKMKVNWYTGSGTILSEGTPTAAFTETGMHTFIQNDITAALTASYATVIIYGEDGISSDTVEFWADDLLIEESTVAGSYFDGSFKGAEWSGTSNASTSKIYSAFPAAEGESFPAIFRSNIMTGLSDPEPVNLTVGAAFTTGSFGQATGANKNEFAMFFRDVPTDNQTMIEMDTRTMAFLDAQGKQPDFGTALFDSRDQEEIDLYDQIELDQKTQYNIERKRDESEHTWMEVRLRWGAENTTINELTIHDADGLGYKWTGIVLEPSKATELDRGKYILIAQIKETWMRAQIYQLNQVGAFVSETPVFDTGKMTDENLMKRRKGRFGWQANLIDGDAHIDDIKTRGVNYGEMITKPFLSVTPVKGVQIFSGSTAEKELIEGVERTQPEFMTLTLDPGASSGGKAIKVEASPLKPLQGISSNTFLIDDPKNIRISFDIKFPEQEIPGGALTAFLLGPEETTYPVLISPYKKGMWSHVKVHMPEQPFQTGGYKFVVMQVLPVTATTWWIENLSAKTYSVKWSARPHKSDAWGLEGPRWREAGFTLNSLNGGIVFPETGSGLQIRAQALRQDAVISEFKAIPQYATLGRIVYKN